MRVLIVAAAALLLAASGCAGDYARLSPEASVPHLAALQHPDAPAGRSCQQSCPRPTGGQSGAKNRQRRGVERDAVVFL